MSQYTEGTVQVVNSDATIIGTNTQFLTEVTAGDYFTVLDSGVVYEVASITDNTNLELTSTFAGSSDSGLDYIIGRDFTTNYDLPEINGGDKNWPAIITRSLRLIDSALNSFVDLSDAELVAIAGLTSAANKIIRFTGSGAADLLSYLDEDTMSSNSDTALASQQSIKAYSDARKFVAGNDTNYEFEIGALTLDGQWNLLDISSYIPVGTVAVAINLIARGDTINKLFNIRDGNSTGGQMSGRIVTQVSGVDVSNSFVIPMGALRKLYYTGETGIVWAAVSIKIIGYWK